uniref:NmrA-like domain-containing protein n=1 Tax=Riquetophycus sp. TaxID=1897556 RepID=A0A1C9C821_9FLOR|nr:hypothetical protein Riqu_051 [Riquetophycus sp.]
MSLLILGATGTLGRQIVRRALDEGFQIKCFVRNFRRAYFLKEWGAELVYGDLKLPETIPLALFNVTAIIDASTAKPSDLYNASQVDLHGKNILIQAAKKANVKRYIFFSILNAKNYNKIPLMYFKLKVEQKLVASGLEYTIFALPGFFQGIISQYALPILENKSVWITGDSTSIAYMDTLDIAKLTIRSLSIKKSKKRILTLSGQKTWTSKQIIELCEKLSGQRSKVSRVPLFFLKLARFSTYFFQWTWNISERLAFTEVLTIGCKFAVSMDEVYDLLNINKNTFTELETYLQEYFTKVMKRLKELNYKMKEQSENTLF